MTLRFKSLVLLLAVLLAGLWFVANTVIEGATADFDRTVVQSLRQLEDPSFAIGPAWLQEMARDITALGSFVVLTLVVVAVAGYLLLRGRFKYAAYLVACVLGGTVLSNGLKMLINRERPEFTDTVRVFTASFPSGHATLSAVVYLTLGVLLAEATTQRSLQVFYLVIAATLVILIGLSRVYLGVHYPTDVLAGWCLGSAWALLCWLGATYVRSRKSA